MKGILAIALTILMVAAPLSASITKRHEIALKGTFVLVGRSQERNIDRVELCTAFAYKKTNDGYLLLTEGHCFIPEAPEDATYAVIENLEDKNQQPVELLRYQNDEDNDVAELHLKTDKKYPVLQLEDRAPEVDDKVFYIGFPEMVAESVITGRVSATKMYPREDCGDLCNGRILIQAGGGPGASGSPVINEKTGKVVGILEGHVYENGIVVVPVVKVKDFLQKAPVKGQK